MSGPSPYLKAQLYAAHKLCVYCLAAPPTTIDHVVPRALGGKNHWNTLPVCEPCNRSKAAMTIVEWMEAYAAKRARELVAAGWTGGPVGLVQPPRQRHPLAYLLTVVRDWRARHPARRGRYTPAGDPLQR